VPARQSVRWARASPADIQAAITLRGHSDPRRPPRRSFSRAVFGKPWRVTVANMHSTTGKIKLLCAVDGCQPVRATSTPRVCWGLGGSLPDAEPGAAQRAADSTWLGNGRAAAYYSLVEGHIK